MLPLLDSAAMLPRRGMENFGDCRSRIRDS